MNAPSPPLSAIRAELDAALVGLREIRDGSLPVRRAETAISEALRLVYEALGCRGDFVVFRDSTRAAVDQSRLALAELQAAVSDDPAAAAETARVARAMGALIQVEYDPNDDSVELAEGAPLEALRATVGEPALLDPSRNLHVPRILLSELPEPEPPLPEPPEPEPVESMAQLRALMWETKQRVEAFERGDEDPLESVDEGEPEGAATVMDLMAAVKQAMEAMGSSASALDEKAEAEHFGEATAIDAIHDDFARDCFEDIGMFGLLRRHTEDDDASWLSCEATEQRLLNRVDAIAALGVEHLEHLVDLLEDRPLPDPELTWALVFLYGSIAGDDSLHQALRLVECTDLEEPAMAERVGDAFSFAPHPRMAGVMREWLEHPEGARRAIAVRALSRRGRITADQARAACVDVDDRVVLEGARALGGAYGSVVASAFAPLVDHADPEIARAAIESAFLRRQPIGLRAAVDRLGAGASASVDAASFVAIGADRELGHRALMSAAAFPNPGLLRALGTFGHVAAVPLLLDLLAGDDDALVLAALSALERITGAGLTEGRLTRDYEASELPFVHGYREPEDIVLALEPDAWRAWWQRYGEKADPGLRYRRGHAWTPMDPLRELASERAGPRERRLCHLEIVARTATVLPFEQEHFVARQRSQIEALWAQLAMGESATPWSTKMVG